MRTGVADFRVQIEGEGPALRTHWELVMHFNVKHAWHVAPLLLHRESIGDCPLVSFTTLHVHAVDVEAAKLWGGIDEELQRPAAQVGGFEANSGEDEDNDDDEAVEPESENEGPGAALEGAGTVSNSSSSDSGSSSSMCLLKPVRMKRRHRGVHCPHPETSPLSLNQTLKTSPQSMLWKINFRCSCRSPSPKRK